jgi:hypothetical protein
MSERPFRHETPGLSQPAAASLWTIKSQKAPGFLRTPIATVFGRFNTVSCREPGNAGCIVCDRKIKEACDGVAQQESPTILGTMIDFIFIGSALEKTVVPVGVRRLLLTLPSRNSVNR